MSRVQNENKMEIIVGDEQDIILIFRALFVGFGPVLSIVSYSVADPGCLSRIRIFSHPGSRIPKNMGR
jgi:hypothetical protein